MQEIKLRKEEEIPPICLTCESWENSDSGAMTSAYGAGLCYNDEEIQYVAFFMYCEKYESIKRESPVTWTAMFGRDMQ